MVGIRRVPINGRKSDENLLRATGPTSVGTSGPINAIYFHSKHGSFWGVINHGEDYGIAW
jgi:hypothetical protein